jgi:hypothetical protein
MVADCGETSLTHAPGATGLSVLPSIRFRKNQCTSLCCSVAFSDIPLRDSVEIDDIIRVSQQLREAN